MEDTEIKNARIEDTFLGIEDHGFLTFWLYLDYGGIVQGFGGYVLDRPGEMKKDSALGWVVRRLLEVVGVQEWDQLQKKYVRVECSWDKIYRIGNIIEDKWFDPVVELKKF